MKDLSALRGMPLTKLWLDDCTDLTDLSPLAEAKELIELTLPPNAKNFEFLRALPKLQRLRFMEKTSKPVAEFWKEYDARSWMQPLRDSGVTIKSSKQLPDGTWELDLTDAKDFSDLTLLKGAPITSLVLSKTAVTDLSPLRGMALKTLTLVETKVADLSPLQGMPLETLGGDRTKVSDLAALKGMPIKSLRLGWTGVTNLEPLRGMPLQTLYLWGNRIKDLSPLRGMPLEDLWLGFDAGDLSVLRGMPLKKLKLHDCPAQTDFSPLAESKELTSLTLPAGAGNLEFLRAFPKLERIGYKEDWKNDGRPDKSAAEFWQEYDAAKK